MTTDISDLPVRSTAALRMFAAHRPVIAKRLPADVAEVNPPGDDGDDYWRFAATRQTVEGFCVKYQGYDAWGDENDCNLNIVPGPNSAWLLDKNLLTSCAAANGAPPFDYCEVKRSPMGDAMIEAEATLDDALYDQFTDDGLPIRGGGWLADHAYNEGKGPTGKQVGVYGVFCGDYGHGGRPEIHPFDAFWRFHSPVGANTASIDIGVFQDDSNRFNTDWSKPPVDVEVRVPFAIDFPVTAQPVAKTVTFEVRKSPRCKKVSNAALSTGQASIVHEYTGPTAASVPGVNHITLKVVDQTGTTVHNLGLGLVEVHVTRAVNVAGKLRACWLSGWIKVRVAIGQDGFWYGNLTGPTSPSALAANGDPITFEPPSKFTLPDVTAHIGPGGKDRPGSGRPIVTGASLDLATRSARVTLDLAGDRQEIEIEARPVTPEFGRTSDARGFGLSTRVAQRRSAPRASGHVAPTEISRLVRALVGLAPRSTALRPVPARLLLLEPAPVVVHAWYANMKEGLPGGETHPASTFLLEQAPPFGVEFTAVVVRRADGTSERLIGHTAASRVVRPNAWRATDGHRHLDLEIDTLRGEAPVVVQVGCTVRDAMGLSADASFTIENVAVVDPARWLLDAIGLAAGRVREAADEADANYLSTCDPRDQAAASLLTMLAEQAVLLEGQEHATLRRVSGVAALAIRASELTPALSLRPPSHP